MASVTVLASARPQRARSIRVPRRWGLRPSDVAALLGVSAALVVGMWIRHDGLAQLGTVGGALTAAGQVTALLGTWVALVQLLLMSRSPWLDRSLGSDRLVRWHRWAGFACLWLLIGHAVFTTAGWAIDDGADLLAELVSLESMWDVLIGTVGLGLLVLVAVTSIRYARRRLSRETWYGLHLYAYLGVALAFAHQLSVGRDFAGDQVAVGYWVALYVVALGSVLVFRVGAPILLTLRHRPVVSRVVTEGPGVVSIYVTGRRLDRIGVRAGQFFQVRFLSGGGWWRPHPFSISAAPNGDYLRFTIKDLGDDTARMRWLRPGTRVALEGPYGAFTAERVRDEGVALIAGGIGITPLRAILEELPPGLGRGVLVYRARAWEDVLFREELDWLTRERGAVVRLLVGQRGSPEMPADPLAPPWLTRLVPDLRERRVFVCGSEPFMHRTIDSLHAIGVPSERIHAERFAF
jgi:predicted ferric reductase